MGESYRDKEYNEELHTAALISSKNAASKIRDFAITLCKSTPQSSLQDVNSSIVEAAAGALGTPNVSLCLVNPRTGIIERTSCQNASQGLSDVNMDVIENCVTDIAYESILVTESYSHALIAPMHSGNGVAGALTAFYDNCAEAAGNKLVIEAIAAQSALLLSFAKVIQQTRSLLDDFAGDNHDLSRQANRDGLTGLLNHRTMQSVLKDMCDTGERPFSLVMADVDHFKHYNDTFGHPKGDVVLKSVADVLASSIRQSDFAARYGGEEFALVLRASKQDALIVAERIRRSVEDIKLEQGSVTISMGVAQFPLDAMSPTDLVAQADKALYAAKRAGRNCVVADGADEQLSDAA